MMKMQLLLLGLFLPLTNAFQPLTRSVSATTSSSSLHMDPQQAWTAYNDALETSPLLVKSVTAGVILGAADLAGQAFEGAQSDDESSSNDTGIDVARTVRFAFFGFILQAPWNHFYYTLLDGAIPPTVDPWTSTTAVKTVIDQFVQAPIFTVLIFAFLGFLEGKNLEAIKKQLDDDYADTMVANWKLWVPATVINLAFVPPILRVLYLNCVFFFWSIFLSLKLNKDGDNTTESL
uniref:Peroxisomal membrane protein MPV17 n=1 Tax=Pseudo-nitzschia australis TaxID=44445 RepID=A0A7S4EG90_9STRA|mmetsp:Transcript_14295/g.29854  ORF Transcript_14295/g.29854 Transcript_14295/m.29854 type:complete len:234 (+) Transcript_14295:150-851(+)